MYLKDKRTLISRNGKVLKEIYCPEKVRPEHIQEDKFGGGSLCLKCNKRIVDTDFVTEKELEIALRRDPNLCLKINLVNPIFEVI